MKKFLALLAATLILAGCTTVAPITSNTAPAYDGQDRDSGIKGVLADNQVLVTGYVKNNYDHLIATYGRDFIVPLVDDTGVFDPIPGAIYHLKDRDNPGHFIVYKAEAGKTYYEIEAAPLTKYLDMCDWSNSGQDPVTLDPHISHVPKTTTSTSTKATTTVKPVVKKTAAKS